MVSRGFRGWEVQYKDGTIITEDQMEWKNIPKINIARLSLHYDGRMWNICDKDFYFQKKRGSAIPGYTDSFRVESRTIGYYDGSSKVMYTVDEDTGKMHVEVKD